MTIPEVDLSRALSHALRHEPWLYELELDDEGWVPVDQLLASLREKGGDWTTVDHDALERMLMTAAKKRHELAGDRIRALYGHSVPGRVHVYPATPPGRLFHGTAPEAWRAIQTAGLLPMGRQFVHLSVDWGTAVKVGQRKSARPVVLVIDAACAASVGTEFYRGNELTWLANSVPSQFLATAGDVDPS